MFAKTQNTVSMILGVALSASALFVTSAFAGEASLSHNEQAGQSAIVATADGVPASVDATVAGLARNERLAQRAIVDVAAPASVRVTAIGEATLTQNEIAAQRAIASAALSAAVGSAGGVTVSVASTRSPSNH